MSILAANRGVIMPRNSIASTGYTLLSQHVGSVKPMICGTGGGLGTGDPI